MRYYGQWMRDEAERRIGHLYPIVAAVQEKDGSYRHATPAEISNLQSPIPNPRSPIQNPKSKIQNLTVIAWLWARTVTCPNPACGAQMPLVRSFELSKKKGKQAWVVPEIDRSQQPPQISLSVRTGKGKSPKSPKIGRGARFLCLACEQVVEDHYVKDEGMAGHMGTQLMAIVAEGDRARIYLPPTLAQQQAARKANPSWGPDANLPDNRRWFSPPAFGMTQYRHLFTDRQLVALTTFSDLVGEARALVRDDAKRAGLDDEHAIAYADAVGDIFGIGGERLSATSNCRLPAGTTPERKSESVRPTGHSYGMGFCRRITSLRGLRRLWL